MSTTQPTLSAPATPPATESSLTESSLIESSPIGPATGGCCNRRNVLRAAGLVALAGGTVTFAACSAASSSPEPGASSAVPSAAETSTAASPSESASDSPAEASSEPAADGTSVPVSEVTVGGGVIVDQKYVVTQPTSGEFKAFSAICTHQGCVVGEVTDGQIVCPCHNSHFDITTGDPVGGPAQQPLPTVAFTESGDTIVVTG